MSGFGILEPSWNLVDPGSALTITSNNENANLPASNLAFFDPSIFHRSNDLTTAQIIIDRGSPAPFDGVMLKSHTITSSGTVRVTGDTGTGSIFTTPGHDSTALSPVFAGDLSSFTEVDFWYKAPTTQTYRYIGIEISDGSNPNGYFDIGSFIAGLIFTPRLGPNLGSSFGFSENTRKTKSVGGRNYTRRIRSDNIMNLVFPKNDMDDSIRFARLERTYGSDIPLVFKWEPKSGNYEQELIIFGRAQWPRNGLARLATGKRWDIEVGIEQF